MSEKLSGKKVAILATNGFEQSELFKPLEALRDAGAEVEIISVKEDSIKAWDEDDWGKTIQVDQLVTNVSPSDYDALMLPGGVMNPDNLRKNEDAVSFVSEFLKSGKPIAAICHAPWLLAETGLLKGRKLTSYSSIKTDLINAGAEWIDEQVVTDNGLVTSRNPSDLPAFCKKMIEEIAEGKHYSLYGNKPSAEDNSAVL